MNSINFPGANATFRAKTISNEKSLRAYVHSDFIRVTAWQLTEDELREILKTGIIFLLEQMPYPNNFSSIKLVVENPVPKMQQLQFPILNETKSKKDAEGA